MQEELQQCRTWASSSTASAVQKAYAAAVLSADGGSDAGRGGDSVSLLELQALRASREAQLQERRQEPLQRQMQLAGAQPPSSNSDSTPGGAIAALAAALSGDAGGGSGAGFKPVLRLRVAGVLPKGFSSSCGGAGAAMVRVWQQCEAAQQLEEGSVVVVTGLTAGTDGRVSTDGRGGLELATTRSTW
jgi:hypothetical protein